MCILAYIPLFVMSKSVNDKEFEAYKKLYDSLTDFGQRPDTPLHKIDYVKARVFDTTVLLSRINL